MGGSRIRWAEIRARCWGVGMGSAGGPEAGSGDPRTYLDPRPPGRGPGGQACRRTLCFLKEGVPSLWEWRGHGCPRADSPCRWMRADRHPVCSAPSPWLSPFASPSLCPQVVLWLLPVQMPLGKCPVIWSPFSAGC